MSYHPDMYLYHATSLKRREKIRENGLKPGSYLGEYDIAIYYAGTYEDNGKDADLIAIPLSAIAHLNLVPDQNGIDEPLVATLATTQDEVLSEWEEGDKTWQDSLDLIRSLRCLDRIPPDLILFDFDIDDHMIPELCGPK
jgi:hypothetical protein